MQQLLAGLAFAVFQLLAGLGQAQCAVDHGRLGIGFTQVILGACGDGAFAKVLVAPGQYHDRQLRVAAHDRFQTLQILAVGQPEVEQDGAVAAALKHAQRCFQRLRVLHFARGIGGATQQGRIQRGIAARVVNQQDRIGPSHHVHAYLTARVIRRRSQA